MKQGSTFFFSFNLILFLHSLSILLIWIPCCLPLSCVYCLWNNHLFFDCFPTAHLQCFPVDFCCLSPYAHWMFPTLFPLFCLPLALCWWVVALHVWLFTKVWYFIVHCPFVIVSLVNCILLCFPFVSCQIDCFHIMLHLSQWFIESL